MDENTKISDKIDGIIFPLPFKDKIKCWELIEELITERIEETKVKKFSIPDVIGSPILAKIEHINDLGKSKWYEVVYYDDGWYSYAGSKTFQDGEQVVDWKYCKDCL
jgi:hypothetical protein